MSRNRNLATSVHPTGIAIRDALLRQRFVTLWRRCLKPGVEGDPGAVWQELARRYAEPHRHYHDKGHLARCLEQLDLAADQIIAPELVEMAIWFHDAINEPGSATNELRSAELFRQAAVGLMPGDEIEQVVGLILATTHKAAAEDVDHQFICDIDLASFGCPWECFLNDNAAVKAEFQGPDENYYRGKRGFLEALLERPKIFLSDFFHRRYEGQARDNIGRLLNLIDQHQDRTGSSGSVPTIP